MLEAKTNANKKKDQKASELILPENKNFESQSFEY